MKKILVNISIMLASLLYTSCFSQNLPSIDKIDKTLVLNNSGDGDTPLIFGYELPDIKSKKLICFSSSTKDIDNNPYKCQLGSYYETGSLVIEYITTEGNFVKLKFKSKDKAESILYFEVEKIRLEDN